MRLLGHVFCLGTWWPPCLLEGNVFFFSGLNDRNRNKIPSVATRMDLMGLVNLTSLVWFWLSWLTCDFLICNSSILYLTSTISPDISLRVLTSIFLSVYAFRTQFWVWLPFIFPNLSLYIKFCRYVMYNLTSICGQSWLLCIDSKFQIWWMMFFSFLYLFTCFIFIFLTGPILFWVTRSGFIMYVNLYIVYCLSFLNNSPPSMSYRNVMEWFKTVNIYLRNPLWYFEYGYFVYCIIRNV